MTWEPTTLDPPATDVPPITEVAPGFPVEFEDPAHVELQWGGDRAHFPAALTPLAGDYARVVGSTLNGWQSDHDGFPHRWHTGVWHGCVYYALEPNATPAEWSDIHRRTVDLWRELGDATEASWRDDILPEVRSLYARMDAVDDDGGGADVAEGWESGWLAAERAWKLHIMVAGLFQVLQDLDDAYKVAVSGCPAGEAFRLILGSRHELFEMELETERLAATAAATPAVASALRTGLRSLDDIGAVPDGETFTVAVEAFLERHGHLGQSSDDLALPSWAQAPERILDELTKRLESPPPSATDRQRRLRREADELATAARAKLADRPEELARFERILDLARRIGPLSEVHNYWIDRACQAHLHGLVQRIARRLVRDKVIEEPADIFYLRRTEVADLLRRPSDVSDLVAERRLEHARQLQITPAPRVGTTRVATATDDQPKLIHGEPNEVGVLRGAGASAGIARGTARVVHGATEFGRILPGDVIVCQASNPSWVPVFAIAAGLVTQRGGILSHAAVVAREFGLPAVVGVPDAMTAIADGQQVEIDGTAGLVRLL